MTSSRRATPCPRHRLPIGPWVLLALGLLAAQPAAADDGWNPRPAAGDVIFPLPCDQKIVFRQVVTSEGAGGANDVLADTPIRLGSPAREAAYLNYLRNDFVAGNFQQGRRRFYLIGKYEVTLAQYKSLMTEGCARAADDDIMPAARVSWYDAENFARRLTSHLIRNAKEQLTRETGTPTAFARLPTETEWEFAARGGLAVSVADFQAERFPMQGPLVNYAWVNDPMSATNVNPIGTRDPNPLKLYDIYGNLAEMMFEPFRLNRAGRLHGLAGGVILKGGSFQHDPAFASSSGREEDTLFDPESGDERRLPNTGFRLVLAGPAVPARASDALQREWLRQGESRTPGGDAPLAIIAKVRESVSDLQMLNALASVERAVRSQAAGDREQQKQLLGALLTNLGATIQDIRELKRRIDHREGLRQDLLRRGNASQAKGLADENEQDAHRMYGLVPFAADTIVLAANLFLPQTITDQARATSGALKQRGFERIASATLLGGSIAADVARGNQTFSRQDLLNRFGREP